MNGAFAAARPWLLARADHVVDTSSVDAGGVAAEVLRGYEAGRGR